MTTTTFVIPVPVEKIVGRLPGALAFVDVDPEGRSIVQGDTTDYIRFIVRAAWAAEDKRGHPYAAPTRRWVRRQAKRAIANGWASQDRYGVLVARAG